MKRLSLGQIISGAEERLGICFISGGSGLKRPVEKPVVRRYQPGDLPFRNTSFILTPEDLKQIQEDPGRERLFMEDLHEGIHSPVFISDQCPPPESWLAFSQQNEIPLCISRHDPWLLESRLTALIRGAWDDLRLMHANLVAVQGMGLLLTGEAGSGKTRLALELIRQGHSWIADDVVILKKTSAKIIKGYAHGAIARFIHLRDRGILPVSACVNPLSIKKEADIRLIVEMDASRDEKPEGVSSAGMKKIMGVSIPHVRLNAWERTDDITLKLLKQIHS